MSKKTDKNNEYVYSGNSSFIGELLADSTIFLPALMVLPTVAFIGVLANLSFKFSQLTSDDSTNTMADSAVNTVAPAGDLSGIWIPFGIAGAVIAVAALAFGAFWLVRRARRIALTQQREHEAIENDRQQALLVWNGFIDRHKALKAKVLKIETDWDILFSYPALVDTSVPQTREFHRALRAVDAVSSVAPSGINLAMDISRLPYPKLVTEASEAWDAAWSFAKATGMKLIPRAERKKVDQIVKLLKLAQSSGGSEHERSIAYNRVAKLISELQFVKVPEQTLKSLEAQSRQMLEAVS